MTAQFTDAEGESWVIRFSTLDIIDGFHEFGVDALKGMDAGAFLGMAWFACRKLAKVRNVSRTQFYEKRVTPDLIPVLTEAVGEALGEAFPTSQESGAADADVPLAGDGKSATS